MWQTYTSACIYIITMKIGLIGNIWVIGSVIRNRRPRNNLTYLSTSDRLRTYIFVLAIIDLTVVSTLIIRTIYAILPTITFDVSICRAVFFIDHLVKLASLICLACISIERYITIRKPFNSQIRQRLFKITPFFASGLLIMVLSALLLKSGSVTTKTDHLNCQQIHHQSSLIIFSGLIVAFTFIFLLSIVSINYGQIVRHVRRKFWKRKARVCASSRQHQLLVSEPRYMRDMTSAIVRVAVFHVICWLPYCIFQISPDEVSSVISTSVRMFERHEIGSGWIAWATFIVNWLTYVNSACDWVFYAVLNRDLRTLIRTNTERRKRSTLSQYTSPNTFHRSLRRQFSGGGHRLLQSGNASKSAPGSFDECIPINSSLPHGSQLIVPSSPKFSNYSVDYMAYSNAPSSPRLYSSCSQKS
uniref:G-protein coupled receptors family 1 profile domain-containing protein n=1 Tax=Parascaris univalens TaxID=6257 RepID=A0A914ZPU2_PARUN